MSKPLLISVLFLGLLGADMADATPSLYLSAGSSDITIADGGYGDLNPLIGAVTYAGSLGGFLVTISTGISKPALGSAQSPHLDLSSIEINGVKGGALIIKFTDTDFLAAAPGPLEFTSSLGGFATAGSVEHKTYLDPNNNPFGSGSGKLLTSDIGRIGTFEESGSKTVNVGASPYSLTQIITVKLPALGLGAFHADLQTEATPEPASLILLGTGLLGVGLWRRRLRARGVRSQVEQIG
jgi:hypothetical protein